MLLKEVKIKNFRGISEWNINLESGFNIIKGENGKGKTSILEAIAVALGGFVEGLDDVRSRDFSKDEMRHIYKMVGDGSYDKSVAIPVEVSVAAILDGELYDWTRGKSSIKSTKSSIIPADVCQKAELMANVSDQELPVLFYRGDGRGWTQRRKSAGNLFRNQYFRTIGYECALDGISDHEFLLNWCARMEQIAWQKERKVAEYEAVKKAAADFMQYMEPGGKYEVFYDKQLEELMYRKEDWALPVTGLSAGYQSLIWMVLDIAYRMAALNPFKKEKIAETQGIVLIDELDMHLHPKWQWNIIQALRMVFPHVQFIAATHSPILFASAKNVWLIDVEKEEIEYSWSHYGIDINTSVNAYQGTQEIPAEVKEKVEEFGDAMDAEDYDRAKKMLEKLETDTAPAHPLLLRLRTSRKRILLSKTFDWGDYNYETRHKAYPAIYPMAAAVASG